VQKSLPKRKKKQQMIYVTNFERKRIEHYFKTGLMILPPSDRGSYDTFEEFEYAQWVHQRLARLVDLYSSEEGMPHESVAKLQDRPKADW